MDKEHIYSMQRIKIHKIAEESDFGFGHGPDVDKGQLLKKDLKTEKLWIRKLFMILERTYEKKEKKFFNKW